MLNLAELDSFFGMAIEPAGVHIDGSRLRYLRKLSGDNLAPFADKVGISLQYLSQIERGDRPSVSPDVFAAICDALKIAKAKRASMLRKVAA